MCYILLGNATSSPTSGSSAAVVTTVTQEEDSTVSMEFKLEQNFTSQLGNKSSEEFKTLANTIKTAVSTKT